MSPRLLTYATLCLLSMLQLQARERAAAATEQFHGIDVSWYQKKINWDVAARDKRITFAIIKATEGGKLQDANYRYNIENARRKGIKVGSYHFLRPETPARQQFDNFKSRVRHSEQDLIPVIDIEDIPEMGIRWKPQQARDMLKQMADLIESHYGCKPMIYTSNKFFTDYLGRAFAHYPLFIARYGGAEPEPLNGTSWTLWQFTKNGRVDGIDHAVDLSRFNKGRSLASIAMHKGKKHAPKGKKHVARSKKDKAAPAGKASKKTNSKKLKKHPGEGAKANNLKAATNKQGKLHAKAKRKANKSHGKSRKKNK